MSIFGQLVRFMPSFTTTRQFLAPVVEQGGEVPQVDGANLGLLGTTVRRYRS